MRTTFFRSNVGRVLALNAPPAMHDLNSEMSSLKCEGVDMDAIASQQGR